MLLSSVNQWCEDTLQFRKLSIKTVSHDQTVSGKETVGDWVANFRGICWAVLMFGGDGWIWYVEILKYKGIIATAVPQEDTAQLEIVLGITNPLFSSNQRYGKKTCLMSLAFRFLYLKYDMLYHFRCVKLMTLFQENLQHTPHIPHPYIALKGLATHNRLLVFLKIAINFQFRCV